LYSNKKVVNPLVLKLSAGCSLQEAGIYMACQLLCMLLANDFKPCLTSSALHHVITSFTFVPKG